MGPIRRFIRCAKRLFRGYDIGLVHPTDHQPDLPKNREQRRAEEKQKRGTK